MTTTSIQEQIDELFADARRMHSPKRSNASNRATSATPQKRPGVLPNAPLTPCYWPAPASSLDLLVSPATASTTWFLQIQPRHRYRAATTAASANCTALVSTLAHATSTPSAASGKPPITLPMQKRSPPGKRPNAL